MSARSNHFGQLPNVLSKPAVQRDLALGSFIVMGTTGSGKNRAVLTAQRAVLLGGHCYDHDQHGCRSHDRVSICCCHNMLLHSNDV